MHATAAKRCYRFLNVNSIPEDVHHSVVSSYCLAQHSFKAEKIIEWLFKLVAFLEPSTARNSSKTVGQRKPVSDPWDIIEFIIAILSFTVIACPSYPVPCLYGPVNRFGFHLLENVWFTNVPTVCLKIEFVSSTAVCKRNTQYVYFAFWLPLKIFDLEKV